MMRRLELCLLLLLLIIVPIHSYAEEPPESTSEQETCQHEWGEWMSAQDVPEDHCFIPDFLYFRRCVKCRLEEYKRDSYGSHYWSDWIIEKATPWKSGNKWRYCEGPCGTEEKIIIPKRKMTAAEEKVYTTAKNLFAYARSYNIKKMNSCFTSKQPSSFFTDNKYMVSYCRKYNKKKLKVTPVDVAVKGNKATITFKVTYPDAYKPLLKACEAMNWNGHSYHSKKGQAKMKAYVKKYTKKYGVKKTTKTIKISLKKTKKGWKISSSSTAIKNAINCNYRTAFKDAK